MSDLFDEKIIKPMLIGEVAEAFDSEDFLFELKLDGERCIAYLDPEKGTELRNKRNLKVLKKVPELTEIHKQVKHRCILDGELVVFVEGKPNFFEIQRRSLTSNDFRIRFLSEKYPASFVAFDILYDRDHETISLPLSERKKLLSDIVIENDRLRVSRFIELNGISFYKLTEEEDLEGIVAKKKDSKYYFDKRTQDWIKIKNLQDDDFVVCGYIRKENNFISVILGKYKDNVLYFEGYVTLGISTEDFGVLSGVKQLDHPPFTEIPQGSKGAVWLEPKFVCTVRYMHTSNGPKQQPTFKGIRFDKNPKECTVKEQ